MCSPPFINVSVHTLGTEHLMKSWLTGAASIRVCHWSLQRQLMQFLILMCSSSHRPTGKRGTIAPQLRVSPWGTQRLRFVSHCKAHPAKEGCWCTCASKSPHADAFKLMQHYNVLMVVNKTWVNKRRAHSWEGNRQKIVPNPAESLLVRQTIFPLGGSANVAMPLIIW